MSDRLYFDITKIENLCNKVISSIGKDKDDPLSFIPQDKVQEYKERLIKHCSNTELIESPLLSEFEISNFPITEIKSMQAFYEEIYKNLCKNADSSENEEADFEKTLYNIIIFLAKIIAKDNDDSTEY